MLNWLNQNFEIISRNGAEVLLVCPYCHTPKLYFNVQKKIGQCKRAKCSKTPSLRHLIEIVGSTPPAEHYLSLEDDLEPLRAEIVELPKGSEQIVEQKDGQLVSRYPKIAKRILDRGVSYANQALYQISFDQNRIYIPIFYEEKMVQYLSRAPWWRGPSRLKYLYAKGRPIGNFLFYWDVAQFWPRLTLVENTFVSIWLQDKLQTVSTFGSNLTKSQLDLIAGSRAETVVLLWDEGAEVRAEFAVSLLRNRGVSSSYCKIKGQPDDHSLEELVKIVDMEHIVARGR